MANTIDPVGPLSRILEAKILEREPIRILLDSDGHDASVAWSRVFAPLGDSLYEPEKVAARVEADWWPFALDIITGLDSGPPPVQRVVLTSSPLIFDGRPVAGYSRLNVITKPDAAPPVVGELMSPIPMRTESYAHYISHELGHAGGLTHQSRSAPMIYEQRNRAPLENFRMPEILQWEPNQLPQWRSSDLLTVQAQGVPLLPDIVETIARHPGQEIIFSNITPL